MKTFQEHALEKKELSKVMAKINFTTLTSLIQNQPPSTIALMLSYLDKSRQKKFLEKIPLSSRKEILFHLSKREMSKKRSRY